MFKLHPPASILGFIIPVCFTDILYGDA